jgi:hypothetical protein
LVVSLFLKKSKIWLVNENFSIFDKSPALSTLKKKFPEIVFFNSKWCKGSLSNYKHVRKVKTFNFPHAIFLPNMENNHYVINEGFIINIPTYALADSLDNPSNVFFPIPGNSKSVKSLFFFYLLTSKSVLLSRYFSSSSFIFKAYVSGKNFFKKNFGYNGNLSLIFFKNYFQFFKKKFLLNTVLFIFKKKSSNIKKTIKKSFNFFYVKLRRKKKKKKKLKLREPS